MDHRRRDGDGVLDRRQVERRLGDGVRRAAEAAVRPRELLERRADGGLVRREERRLRPVAALARAGGLHALGADAAHALRALLLFPTSSEDLRVTKLPQGANVLA